MAGSMQLAELVCAKFSHDLSGLLGSLNGVLELVGEAPGHATEEIALAVETAAEMMLRLQLLRSAWGGVAEPMDVGTLKKQAGGVSAGRRLQFDLEGLTAGGVFPPPMARLVLNVMLLAAEAMPRGGVLALSGDPTSRVVAQIAGPNAAWPAGFALCIADEAQAWAALTDPRSLQAPFTALIARASGMKLSLMMATGPSMNETPPPLVMALAA